MGRNGKVKIKGGDFMKRISVISISMLLCLCFIIVNAEDTMTNQYLLYVNGTLIEATDSVTVKDKEILFPIRTIFESLGATVNWQEETGNILITYNDELYICYTKEPNPGYSKYFYIKKKSTDEHIYLTAMSTGGAYCMINYRTYLYQETGKRMFEALGCKVEIDSNKHTVKIYNK